MSDPSKLRIPRLPLPESLRGLDKGSFTEYTVSVRLPDITRRVLQEREWSSEIAASLQALVDSIPNGIIRPLQDDGASEVADWHRYMMPYLGQTWLQIPWLVAENYMFRRILESTNYFRNGPEHGVDPYTSLKQQGMLAVPDTLIPLCAQLEAFSTQSRPDSQQTQEKFAELLRMAVWGNQADLSVWWSEDQEHPSRPENSDQTDHLLDDDSIEVSNYIGWLEKENVRVDFILDNGGVELAYDLVLGDFLLSNTLAHTIYFHPRVHPTFVSDVTSQDVLETIKSLSVASNPGIRDLGLRWMDYITNERVYLTPDYFWTSPLCGWDMPDVLWDELSCSDLIISKGDINYRRWVGDRHWISTEPLEDVLSYAPAPLLVLRVLKGETIVGLQPGQKEKLDRMEPQWMSNGNYGIIQFVR